MTMSSLGDRESCPNSLCGKHLPSPNEAGIDVEARTMEYFCLRCGELIRSVEIQNFDSEDYEVVVFQSK